MANGLKQLGAVVAVLTLFVVPSIWKLWDRSYANGERIAAGETRDEWHEKQLEELKDIQRQQIEIFRALSRLPTPTPKP